MFAQELEILKYLQTLRTEKLEKIFEYITMLGEETPMVLVIAILYFAVNKSFAQKLLFYQFRHAFVYCFDADAIGRCTSATSSAGQNLRRVRRALHFDHREINSLDSSEGHCKIVVVSSSKLR